MPDQPVTEVPERMFPTKEEARNGWTGEALRAYMTERRQQQIDYAGRKRQQVVIRNVGSYEPLNW